MAPVSFSVRYTAGASSVGLPERRVEDGPEVDRPAEEKEPENGGETELKDGAEETALKELAQPRYEKAA